MSKLGVLLTICLLLFPITALPVDGDQPADRPVERMQDNISSEQHPFFEKRAARCCTYHGSCLKEKCRRKYCCGR
uniref:Psi-conotoxin PrIIIE n=1 Tax=Conus parius TaxID=505247 RepID=CM3E_CONPI|nr:RecName: Full=Psi-conotoxin PrIIIE; AltName: Full=Psi-conotoxin Pr3.5; AltName: Full=Psi-conotoxin pr3e; Flags: Precursor [Conus parius]